MGKASRRKNERKSADVIRQFQQKYKPGGNPAMLRALCMDCIDFMQREYPHYAWGIKPSVDGSMIEIVCDVPGISTRHGYEIRTMDVENVTQRRPVLRNIGGEILERFGLARHARTEAGDVKGTRNTLGQLQPEL